MTWQQVIPWFLYPAVGAGIGWLTNWLAIRLLFRPHRPLVLGWWQIQGLLPRRRHEMAASIAQVVEEELFSHHDLLARLTGPRSRRHMVQMLTQAIVQAFQDRLPIYMPRGVTEIIARLTRKEVDRFLHDQFPALLAGLLNQVQVASLVQERLDELNLHQLEQLVYRVAARELKHIEGLGALVGGFVGLLQAVLVLKFGLGLPGR